MTKEEITQYVKNCPYSDKSIDTIHSCGLEFHYRKICPSKECVCAKKFYEDDMVNKRVIEWFKNSMKAMPISETKKMFRMAIAALEKQEEDRWILATERLPKEDDYKPCYGYDDGAVWWLNDIGMMGLGWYYTSTENWAFYNENTHTEGIVGNVIAWRPLPESFREEEV